MITGFNTDIKHKGVTYHVQTEDKGLDSPLILSLVYVGGAIIASKRTPYGDLVAAGFDEKTLTERLQRQHKLICAAIKAGRVEELKRMNASSGAADAQPASKKSEATAAEDDPAVVETADSNGKNSGAPTLVGSEEFIIEDGGPVEIERGPKPDSIQIITSLIDEISAMSGVPKSGPDVLKPPPIVPPIHEEFRPEEIEVERAPAPADEPPGAAWPDDTDELYLSLLDDEGDFRAGQLVLVKIYVGRGTQGHWPAHGAQVTVKVLGSTFRPMIQTAETDKSGVAVVRAHLPSFKSGRAAIIIRAVEGDNAVELRRIIHQ